MARNSTKSAASAARPKGGKKGASVVPTTTPITSCAASGIEIIPDGKYPLIAHGDISLPPRPEPGQEIDSLFFNPRPLDEVLNPDKLCKLIYSIRLEDLLEPVAVNIVTEHGNKAVVVKVELLAGERRKWAIEKIISDKLPCVDEVNLKPETFVAGAIVNWKNRFGTVVKHVESVVTINFADHFSDMTQGEQECDYAEVLPTIPGDEKHKHVPCKTYHDLTDERKMRISFSENDNSEPLSAKAEVDLIERLLRRGKKQAEVAHILSTNITFVSQRACFRTQLPAGAFEKLMNGNMAAHVAVGLLGYDSEVRQALYDAMVDDEKAATGLKIRKLRGEREALEDEAETRHDAARKAARDGDEATAQKEERRGRSAEGKASRVREREQRTQQEAGTLKEGNSKRAAAKLGVTPRKAKMMAKEQVNTIYVKGLTKFVSGGEMDPICGEEIPAEYVSIMRRTAKAILEGQLDPLSVIREYMVENDQWTLPPETEQGKKEPPKPKPKGGKPPEDDEEEDDEEEGGDDEEEAAELDDLEGPAEGELEDEDDFSGADEDEDDADEDRPRRRKRRRRREDDGDIGERLAYGSRLMGDD